MPTCLCLISNLCFASTPLGLSLTLRSGTVTWSPGTRARFKKSAFSASARRGVQSLNPLLMASVQRVSPSLALITCGMVLSGFHNRLIPFGEPHPALARIDIVDACVAFFIRGATGHSRAIGQDDLVLFAG